MNNETVSTLKLSGEDSIRFINSLIRPTVKEKKHWQEHMERIESTLQIVETDMGYEIEVKDLDISIKKDSR